MHRVDPLDQEAALARLGLERRVGGGVLLVDEPWEVGAATAEAGVFVGWLDVSWTGPATPVWRMRDVVHVPVEQGAEVVQPLRAAIAGAADARERGLVTCRECRDRQLPGRMDGNVCQGCAEAGGAMH